MSENLLTKRIKDWAKTALRSHLIQGNYIPMDGINGTQKIPAEFLSALNNLYTITNDEYIFAIVDSENAVLFGIKNDGFVEWAKGLPEHLQKILNTIANELLQKVDKVPGKWLVDSTFANGVSFISDEEYVFAIIDNVQSVLLGIRRDGKIDVSAFTGGKLIVPAFSDAVNVGYDSEYALVFLGADDSVLLGIRKDGKIVSDALFSEIKKKIEDYDVVNTQYVDDAVRVEKERAEQAEQGLQDAINNINPTVVEGGSNNPDQIFLTEINGAITLKGTSNLLYGKKIKYVSQNDSLLTTIVNSDTIYIIRFAHNINGTLNIPSGCILLFEGGSIYNGILVGNNTGILYRGAFVAPNVSFSGTWNVEKISSKMLVDPSANNALLKLVPLLSDDVFNEFEIAAGNYTLSVRSDADTLLNLTSNTLLRIDGEITLTPNGYPHYNIIYASGKKNIEITGGGVVRGDADEHDYITTQSTHEWGMCIELKACENINIHDISLSDATGDGIELAGENIIVKNVFINHCGRQGISVLTANNVIIENVDIDDIYRTAPMAAIDIEPYTGVFAKNVFLHNIKMSNCAGIQILYCNGVKINNVAAEDCNILFFGTDAENVSIEDVRYFGDAITGENFFKFNSGCKNIYINKFDVRPSVISIFDISNVFVGMNMDYSSDVRLQGNPVAGSIKYDSGKCILFNGLNWVNLDGTSL